MALCGFVAFGVTVYGGVLELVPEMGALRDAVKVE